MSRFAPGDQVVFTNDYGVSFAGRRVVAIDDSQFAKEYGPRYFVEPTDSPWFSKHERNLTIEYVREPPP